MKHDPRLADELAHIEGRSLQEVGKPQTVIVVTPSGTARVLLAKEQLQADEAQRIAAVKAMGQVPDGCCPDIPEAPARGTFRVVEPQALYPDGKDGFVSKPAGYRGRKVMERSDAFDVMEAQARKVLFTPGQKAMGRLYAVLTERLASSGMRCSSVEALRQQAGSGGEYIDAVIRDRRQLEQLQRRIGGGVALQVRRVRPSQRNRKGLILDRTVVDQVCIEGRTIAEVLTKAGWVAPGQRAQGKHIKDVRAALCAALDRMAGPVRSEILVLPIEEAPT